MKDNEAVLQLQNLSIKSCRHDFSLEKISLSLNYEQTGVVWGLSLSGKSLLCETILGTHPFSSGEIWIQGRYLKEGNLKYHEKIRLDCISIISNNFSLIPGITLLENFSIIFLMQNKNIPKNYHDIILKSLHQVQLNEKALDLTENLNKNEIVRALIARCFLKKPTIILADDPTSSFDVATATSLISLIRNLNHENHSSLLFFTNDTRLIMNSDIIYELNQGTIHKNVSFK